MNHANLLRRLSDYLDDDLPASERVEIESHLAECQPCARELAELRETMTLLRSLPDPLPPPELARTVMRRIRDGEGRRTVWASWHAAVLALGAPRFAVPIGGVATLLIYAAVSGDPASVSRPAAVSVDPIPPAAAPLRPVPRSAPMAVLGAPRFERATPLAEVAPPSAAAAPDSSAVRSSSGAAAFLPTPSAAVAPALPAASLSVAEALQSARIQGGAAPLTSNRLFLARTPGAASAPLAKAERRHRELDLRLDLLLERPAAFAALLMADSVAAQELWLVELAERALEREIAQRSLEALRRSTDPGARSLADGFGSAVARVRRAVADPRVEGSSR